MTRIVPNTFGALLNPSLPNLDADFAAIAPTIVLPCTAVGTNAITLTPVLNTLSVSAYTDKELYSFVAVNNSTAAVSLQIGILGALNLYKAGGITQVGSGDITTGDIYIVAYQSALNSSAGGFVIVSAVGASGGSTILRDYIAGYVLSNDSGTPNSILDIAAGQCTDSTNALYITLTAFTKSTGGSWAAGSGSNAMGQGLTIAVSTWYHVFAIVNSGLPDVYFDTSASAANAPGGTTSFRRIGSFKTDGSAHILAFTQIGETFFWGASTLDFNSVASSSGTMVTVNTPLGVQCGYIANFAQGGVDTYLVTSPSQPNEAPSTSVTPLATLNGNAASTVVQVAANLITNTSSQIRIRSIANNAMSGAALGWIDRRGNNA